jgi:hypothetical protein
MRQGHSASVGVRSLGALRFQANEIVATGGLNGGGDGARVANTRHGAAIIKRQSFTAHSLCAIHV